MTVQERQLGGTSIDVPLGLGCMSLTGAYGPASEEDAAAVINAALSHGIQFFDTADFYGNGRNEEIVGKCLQGRRDVQIATKTGVAMGPDRKPILRGRPEQLKAACELSLKRLGVETIDLFILARVDTAVPIEDSVGAMGDPVAAGKVRKIGLSEISSQTLARAMAVHPIAAVESEYSLAEREVEESILPATRDAGIAFLAYSPLGRGLLSGAISSTTTFEAGDFRKANPRFASENLAANSERAVLLGTIATEIGVTSPQLALAWLLTRGSNVIPIFGTRSPERLIANLQAASLQLPRSIVERLSQAFPLGWARGARYPEPQMALIDG